MAIVKEDGTGLTTSNSYVTEAEVTAYATNRGKTLTATASVLIYKAMDYMETLNYIGDKQTEAQALQWPRDGVYVDGFYIEPTTIPVELRNAQLSLCIAIDEGTNPMDVVGRATKREKVDVLEVEYLDSAASKPIITSVNRMLSKLLKSGTNGTSFVVSRG